MSNGKGNGDPFDTRLVRKLADILNATDLTEIEVEQGDLKIRVAREIPAAPMAPVYAPAPMAAAPVHYAPSGAAASPATPASAADITGEVVKSPMVGTVYLQATPGADAFVSVGAKVKSGQTLLIIEAMKTMNPITAPRDGVVLDILVSDGQPVEFGEPLVVLE
ncbi:MAG TPA: acetyl-CoA carboxylase biotin carboxyl carrier protein [Caulobacteraceae bacterium]|jgi:acetyl-CoA carboxylase biotin carboxyl carrier protein|nr:acetyl-CoA carboxylase biotin carboxyl carrier protein [Caulobacteraceae bacterium]